MFNGMILPQDLSERSFRHLHLHNRNACFNPGAG
jgi:hypothetical protein